MGGTFGVGWYRLFETMDFDSLMLIYQSIVIIIPLLVIHHYLNDHNSEAMISPNLDSLIGS